MRARLVNGIRAALPLSLAAALSLLLASPAHAQGTTGGSAAPSASASLARKYNLETQPTLYTVAYAHLDTEWNWDYPTTITQYLPKTMQTNFALFAKYPDYVFNFSGANRYRMMKEYFPAMYDTLKMWVAKGRWFPAGSSMEEGDVNAPSSEAILREVLYGNDYFRKEFGKASAEYMLPDCFGFPWSLPTILAHAGVKGFSTQKLTWGSSVPDQPTTPNGENGKGIAFNYGFWAGPDGKGVVAALNPGSYSGSVGGDISLDLVNVAQSNRNVPTQTWGGRLAEDKKKLGLMADYFYYGTGDTGGSPSEASVNWIQTAINNKNPKVHVISATADQFFNDLSPAQIARLPKYASEMELQEHSAGSLTSQTYRKRWNRMNEILADAAEKASIAAQWIGGRTYPLERLNHAWALVMGGHFHDIMAGTAIPRAYQFSWNDDVIAMNQFASVVTSASDVVTSAMNTQTEGTPIVVYNSLNIAREDVVEATVPLAGGMPSAVRVVGPDGKDVPAQISSWNNGEAKILFLAKAPSVGYAVYDVRRADASTPAVASTLRVTNNALENARYRIAIDANGDLSSIFDKSLNRELLGAPARLAFQREAPTNWPAWNMDFRDQRLPPRGYVDGPVKVSITENGAARVGVTIERSVDSSKYVQTVHLSAGDAGNRVEFSNVIDWKTEATALKAQFVLTASNPNATYNWDVGTIVRGNNYDRKYEVPSHQWFDLTDRGGTWGVTVLSDSKNASDKPDDHTLRLTLLYSPGLPTPTASYRIQYSQDWGHHEFIYGLAGHAGDYRTEQTDWQALRLNEPLMAFEAPKHAGALGKTFSLVKVNNNRVRLMAVKKAENSNEIIVRLNEINGTAQSNVHVTFAAPIVEAREVNGQEQPLGAATIANGDLVTSLTPFTIRSFAIRLGPVAAGSRMQAPASQPVALTYDLAVASNDNTQAVGGFAADGCSYPAEMIPATLPYAGINFKLAPAKTGVANAVVARGQQIALPAGQFTRVYLLAAAAGGDQKATFRVGDKAADLDIQDWAGWVGQWDNRTTKRVELPYTPAELEQQRVQAAQRAAADSARRASGDTTTGRGGRGGAGGRGAAGAAGAGAARGPANTPPPPPPPVGNCGGSGEVTTALAAGGNANLGRGRGNGGGGGGGGGGRGNAAAGGPPPPRMIEVVDTLQPGFIKRAPIAWFASHRHTAAGLNEPYAYSYMFAYTLDIPGNAKTLTLPSNPNVRILAVTVANDAGQIRPAHPLYDTLQHSPR